MIGLETILYTFVCGAMLMMSILGLESAIVTPSLDRPGKRFFIFFFSVLTLGSATFFLELAVYLMPELKTLQMITYFLQSLLYTAPFLPLAAYLLSCCGESWRNAQFFHIVLTLWIVYFVMVCVSQFTTVFWYVTPDGVLQSGPLYSLLAAPLLTMLLFITVGVVQRRGKLSRRHYRAFLICLLPTTVCMFVHVLMPVYTLLDVSLTISAFSMYRFIEAESVEQNLRHQQEIASQRSSIAVLQMRPHFIYNTMTSIYYLCDQDSELAKKVTMDFAIYLRKNLTAIASENAIPFSEELEHARAYLAVEQAQFEDALLVDFDTPYIEFRVPPLTLQPIVENAIKHGMDPDSGLLHIWVRTKETDSSNEVIVEDDGPGFDPAIADDPHTTLANIRQRLNMMCGGKLDIKHRADGGTIVKVTVPRRG